MRRVEALIAALVFVFAAAGRAHADDQTAAAQVEQLIRARYNERTPGMAVVIVKDGTPVLRTAAGVAHLEHGIPITTRTVFNAGSVSKQFVAFSVYLLEKRGLLSFEDDVRKHVPEVPDFGKTVRIRHLLAHTSGLRDQAALMALAGWRSEDVATRLDFLRVLRAQKGLNFDPGTDSSYSNSGFILLAEIVGRLTGQTFAEFARKEIFVPLGMNDSQFQDDFRRVAPNRASAYFKDDGVFKEYGVNSSIVGGGGLLTTPEDLAKWAVNYESPKVGDAELIAKFNQPSLLDNGQPSLYAVIDGENSYHAKGQFTRNYRGLDLLNHTGHAGGYWAYLLRFPGKRLSIILMSNDDGASIFATGMTIAEFYLKDDLKPKATPTQTPPPPAPTPTSVPPRLTDFEGDFVSEELSATYSLKVREGKLVLSHLRTGEHELASKGGDRFDGRIDFPVEVNFVRDANGAVVSLTVSNFGVRNLRFGKVMSR